MFRLHRNKEVKYNVADLMLAVLDRLDEPPYIPEIIGACADAIAYGKKHKRPDLCERGAQIQRNVINFMVGVR